MKKKPFVKIIGENGNIFNLVGIAKKALKKVGQHNEASEMVETVFNADSYESALRIIMEYCNVIGEDENEAFYEEEDDQCDHDLDESCHLCYSYNNSAVEDEEIEDGDIPGTELPED